MEKMDYKSFVISVQGITQMFLDSYELDIEIAANVCEADKDGKHYMGVELQNVTGAELITVVERYYLEEMYKQYLQEESSIAEIAQMMIMEYLMKLNDSVEE